MGGTPKTSWRSATSHCENSSSSTPIGNTACSAWRAFWDWYSASQPSPPPSQLSHSTAGPSSLSRRYASQYFYTTCNTIYSHWGSENRSEVENGCTTVQVSKFVYCICILDGCSFSRRARIIMGRTFCQPRVPIGTENSTQTPGSRRRLLLIIITNQTISLNLDQTFYFNYCFTYYLFVWNLQVVLVSWLVFSLWLCYVYCWQRASRSTECSSSVAYLAGSSTTTLPLNYY